MKVFVAGAASALGSRTCRQLVEHGHDVYGLTRSRGAELERIGVTPVTGDMLDPPSLRRAVASVEPDAIVQTVNALPKDGPSRFEHLPQTGVLRIDGTRNLIAASRPYGVRRYVVESLVIGYGGAPVGAPPVTEDAPFIRSIPYPELQHGVDALASMEAQVREIGGVSLRMGFFYGRGVGSTEFAIRQLRRRAFPALKSDGLKPFVHIEDAASAIVAALDRGEPGGVYNIAGEPATIARYANALATATGAPKPLRLPVWFARLRGKYLGLLADGNLPVSTDKARRELGWSPKYPTVEEGAYA